MTRERVGRGGAKVSPLVDICRAAAKMQADWYFILRRK